MGIFLQDLRYGVRTLTRTPGFSLVAMAVLAVGIGVNATVFSLANAFFFRPLPIADPSTVVRVYSSRYANTRHRTYLDLRDRNATLSGLAAFRPRSFALRVDGDSEPAFGEIVSGNYFPVLGISAARGRLLGPSDDQPGAAPAAVLSHGFWLRRFAGAPDAVGRTIAINDQPFTIVGVAASDFQGVLAPLAQDFWVPLATDALLRPGVDPAARIEGGSFHLVGRLKPGVERSQAQADLDTIGRQLRDETRRGDPNPAVTVYGATRLHPEASQPVTAFTAVLMTVVALVLLIVCVNLANLVLSRAAGRDAELAIRQSLGAGRGRLLRQLLTENLLLSFAGAAVGVALAVWATRVLMAVQLPVPIPIALDLPIDLRVLTFTVAAAVGATLMFGMLPALTVSRVDLVRPLKGIGADGPRHGRLRSAFLVAQVSMSVLLLIVAGLFIRGFRHAQSLDLGFDAGQVMTAAVDLETRGYDRERGGRLIESLVARLAGTPGIHGANAVDIVPLTLSNNANYMLRDIDEPPARDQRPLMPLVYSNAVTPGHFSTLKIPMAGGRDFTTRDDDGAPDVAIVNEMLARTFWPGAEAIGQRLRLIDAPRNGPGTVEIVGVVRDSKYTTVGEGPTPFLYRPLAQEYTPRVTVLVRGEGAAAVAAIKAQVRALDPGLAVFNIETLSAAASISLLPARVAGTLLAGLGIFALALAALGIFGVLSYLVRSRTREIGVRMAMGASPRAVAAMVVRQALTWTLTGAAIGIVLALVLTRFLTSFLYGTSPTDPLTFAGVTALIALVACVAALVPTRRASRLDPLVALRDL